MVRLTKIETLQRIGLSENWFQEIGGETMKRSLMLFLLPLLLAISPLAHGASATACLDRSTMVDTLTQDYGEQLAEVRKIKDKGLLEFYVSPDEGNWTAVLTSPKGISCVLAVGEGLDPAKSFNVESGYEA